MFVRTLPVAPDVAPIARALLGEEPCAVLHSSTRGGKWGRWSYVCVGGREQATSASTPRSARLPAFPRTVGVIPYEACRFERPTWAAAETRAVPAFVVPRWLAFEVVVGIDHEAGDVIVLAVSASAGHDAIARIARGATPARRPAVRLVSQGDPTTHAERVRAAKDAIASGHVYQVNLARKLHLEVDDVSPRALLELSLSLSRWAPSPFGALIHFGDRALVSTTPELLLDVSRDAMGRVHLVTEPIKGTRTRGVDAPSDRALARELDADPKERAELAMIVDVARNDLNVVCDPGSVRLLGPPVVHAYGAVLHRIATVTGRLRAGLATKDAFDAMIPAGSVTGAPKVRAMELIRTLEEERRGLYTGGFGFFTHDDGARLAMAIRTLEVGADGRASYATGGGIVADSDPLREVEETRWKAAQILRLLA